MARRWHGRGLGADLLEEIRIKAPVFHARVLFRMILAGHYPILS
jgi:hypothetical protein